MTSLRNKIARLHWSVLRNELAELRGDVDGLAARFNNEYGGGNEAAQRAEQLAAAIQRLEWALARQHLRRLSAVSGAGMS
jgi:chromosome segregation ATPase